jgi:diguanylate cyclase (GGDEF)-like protein/PAS domain S-box-containing protein
MTFTAMSGSYHHGLVVLYLLLATVASYAALGLAGRVTRARGRLRTVWLSCGATAMGLGFGAMHYLGMLALTLPIPVAYHLPTVILSLLAAITASAVALYVVSGPTVSLGQEFTGSLVMGSGFAALHYLGIAAMRCSAVIVYDTGVVAVSLMLAIAASYAALKLSFRVRDEQRTSWGKIITALLIGSAIPLMDYTGMWAATFYGSGVAPNLSRTINISALGVWAICSSTFFVLAGAIAVSFFDRFMALYKGDLSTSRARELYFQTMAEEVAEIIWTADRNGEDDYFNRKGFDYTGMTLEQLRGSGWKDVVHPDDANECFSKWQNALRVGEPYDVEYRLRAKDGTYRWFLGRANPIRNSTGEIIKWFGTCTDIESQKHNQQILEAQILERTTQLADANTRLQEEMLERDFARNALDQQNARMMNELEKRSERATMLAKMGELLQSCVSREEVFAAALGFAPKIFPGIRGAVALLNGGRSLAEVIGSWTGCQLPMMEFESTACWALRTGHAHLVLAGDNTARCAHAPGIENTYLCVPILAQGETLGIVHFQYSDAPPQLDPSERSFKTTFAGQVGLSIANIRLREALHTQSVRDALTGLYNRRYLEEVLDREVRRAGRAGQSLAVLMLDLDHFKRFNDTYGHDAGDAVLRETAFFLLRNVRAEDFVCRYGGEEFVVILPTAGLDGARARAERLRSRMRELNIMYQGKSLGTGTFSVGVAAFPEHGTSPKDLMAAADAALYEAKRGGRNQVALAPTKSGDGMAMVLEETGLEKSPARWG